MSAADEKGVTAWEENTEIPADLDKRITRKLDTRIVPWLFGLWLLAFIDRSNIGNARIDGLAEDLDLGTSTFVDPRNSYSYYFRCQQVQHCPRRLLCTLNPLGCTIKPRRQILESWILSPWAADSLGTHFTMYRLCEELFWASCCPLFPGPG
jgi:hypothetical protein